MCCGKIVFSVLSVVVFGGGGGGDGVYLMPVGVVIIFDGSGVAHTLVIAEDDCIYRRGVEIMFADIGVVHIEEVSSFLLLLLLLLLCCCEGVLLK